MPYKAHFGHASDFPAVAKSLYRFRKNLFVDQCGWDLPTRGDCEIDAFDQDSTIYCATYCGSELVGTFRAIRCDSPYLAADVFPQLASLQRYPRDADCWEISRFGVVRSGSVHHARANYALMFRFAREVGARALVAVADLTYERFLSGLGITTNRYGPPQPIGFNRAGTPLVGVAGEIPLAGQSGARFQKLIELGHQTEIVDASHVFRRERVPA